MAKMHYLKNGLRVLLEENHAAPVVSFHILVKVGSAMESKKEAGISHLIEHMLFKGTPKRKVGAIAKEVEAAGGEINAYTSFDQTVYYINMASRFAPKGLDILADAIQNPIFDADELEREKEVVLEEIRRGKDSPSQRNSDLLFSTAYSRHPYKNPIIGTAKSVKSFTKNDVMRYYKQWYRPDNVVVVIVGDFNKDKMLKDVAKKFKKFRAPKTHQKRLTKDKPSTTLKIKAEENHVQACYFSIGFKIPGITHKDVPALDILSHVLAGTDSSRLEQIIKEQKELVNDIHSYAFTPKHEGLFIIGGLTSPEKLNESIKTICDEVHKLHNEPITISELNRAKLNLRSSEIYERESIGGQAGKYAWFLANADSHEYEKEYYRMLNDVQTDQIMKVTQKYIVPNNATVIIVHPHQSSKHINLSSLKKHFKTKKPSKTSLIKRKTKVSPPVLHKLPNGIKLIIRENHRLPLVCITAAFLGGLRYETKENNGINTLLARTLTKGTKRKNALQIAKKIESIAGSIGAFSGKNSFGLRSEFLSEKFEDGFSLFSEILTEPSFEANEIEKERKQQIDAIKNEEDMLMKLALNNFLSSLYTTHPYGLRMLGEIKSVNKLTRTDLLKYYNQISNPKNMVISVVGDISPEEVLKAAEQRFVFSNKPSSVKKAPLPQKPNLKPITTEHTKPGKEQAHIVIGFLGSKISSEDHYTIAVLNNILSGQGGRLFLILRDQMSLAYAVTSTHFEGLEPGFIAMYIGTEASKINTAIGGMMKELNNLLKNGVTNTELSRAKNYIIGSFELDKQRNHALADSYAFNVLYNLGLDHIDLFPDKINAVTKNDIQKVIKKYLKLDAPITSIIKPE